jgi:hypothetical protein
MSQVHPLCDPWRVLDRPIRQVFPTGHVVVWAFLREVGPLSATPPQTSGSQDPRVQQYVGVQTGRWISHDGRGKPTVAGWHVSLSATRGATVLAISRDVQVGVDVERVRRMRIDGGLRYLTALERGAAGTEGGEIPVARFLRMWTRKEAWSKLDGRGIDASWFTTTVTERWPDPLIVTDVSCDAPTQVVTLAPLADFEVALALSRDATRVTCLVVESRGSGAAALTTGS